MLRHVQGGNAFAWFDSGSGVAQHEHLAAARLDRLLRRRIGDRVHHLALVGNVLLRQFLHLGFKPLQVFGSEWLFAVEIAEDCVPRLQEPGLLMSAAETLGPNCAVAVEQGDIFSADYLDTLAKLNDEIYLLPGVDRPYMKSLWTPATRWPLDSRALVGSALEAFSARVMSTAGLPNVGWVVTGLLIVVTSLVEPRGLHGLWLRLGDLASRFRGHGGGATTASRAR